MLCRAKQSGHSRTQFGTRVAQREYRLETLRTGSSGSGCNTLPTYPLPTHPPTDRPTYKCMCIEPQESAERTSRNRTDG